MSFWGVVFASTLGSYAGSSLSYFVAQSVGRPLILRYGKYFLVPEKKWLLAEQWIQHYSAGRHLLRAPASGGTPPDLAARRRREHAVRDVLGDDDGRIVPVERRARVVRRAGPRRPAEPAPRPRRAHPRAQGQADVVRRRSRRAARRCTCSWTCWRAGSAAKRGSGSRRATVPSPSSRGQTGGFLQTESRVDANRGSRDRAGGEWEPRRKPVLASAPMPTPGFQPSRRTSADAPRPLALPLGHAVADERLAHRILATTASAPSVAATRTSA